MVGGVLGLYTGQAVATAAARRLAASDALAVAVHIPTPGEVSAPSVVRAWGAVDRLLSELDDADVGLYETSPRYLRRHLRRWELGAPTPGVGSIFLCPRRPGLTADEYHRLWELSHGPKALRHHVGMWDYEQVSIVARHHGPDIDGVAVVQWPNAEDLADRFFDSEDGALIIRDDAASFTDLANTERYLMTEHLLVEAPWPDQPVSATDYRSLVLPASVDLAPEPGVRVEWRPLSDSSLRLDWQPTTTASAATVFDVAADLARRWDEVCERLP